MIKVSSLFLVVASALGMTGCITTDHKDVPATWPVEVRSADERKFRGLFRNQSASDSELAAPEHSNQLFDYLANHGRFKGQRGTYVRIRFLPAEETLEITLLDEARRKIDLVLLKKDKDYIFTEGAIRIKTSFTASGNVGGGVEWFDFRLSMNSNNGLLGKNSGGGAALLFYFLPIAGSGTDWLLWPRISN